MLHDVKFNVHFQNPWCWSVVFRHGILNQFVFRYVTICCWNNFLRCPMFIKFWSRTRMYRQYGTVAVLMAQDNPKRKIQFLMSQAWKCVSSVCGIVTNHMHGDNFNWESSCWVDSALYLDTLQVECFVTVSLLIWKMYQQQIQSYIYINLFIVLSLKLRKFWGMPLAIYVHMLRNKCVIF